MGRDEKWPFLFVPRLKLHVLKRMDGFVGWKQGGGNVWEYWKGFSLVILQMLKYMGIIFFFVHVGDRFMFLWGA